MKITIIVLAMLLGLLSIAAGAAKVALVPEEVDFLSQFGLSNLLIIAFGVAQALGGALLIVPRTRYFGALICAASFAASAGMLLASGNLAFGGLSFVPVVLALVVAYQSFIDRSSTNPIANDA